MAGRRRPARTAGRIRLYPQSREIAACGVVGAQQPSTGSLRKHSPDVHEVVPLGGSVVPSVTNAYEELRRHRRCLHWSVTDPVRADTDEVLEEAFNESEARLGWLAAAVATDTPGRKDYHG